jgi:hypothetical protein
MVSLIHKITKAMTPQRPGFWMVLACAIWLVLFREYFTGRIALFSDAVSYFDHTHYYLESLKRGVFPLWDYFWQNGSPNEFFLRRIGCYNPIYLWMLLLQVFGLPSLTAYLLTHAFYFFLGTAGFYLLAKAVYKDERVAFTAFLLLLFSAAGTRVFDSYMCLVIVPTIWSFYFAFAFLSSPGRWSLTGLALSFIIAMNTYIPLFYLTIVFAAAIFWVLFFFQEAREAGKKVIGFFARDKVFFSMISAAVVLALIPPLAFFMSTAVGVLSLPERHGASTLNHVLSVDTKLLSWGVMEDLFFTSFYSDFRRFILALVYVPFFSLVLWALGGLCRANRRVLYCFALGIFFILLGTPLAVPLHAFLYKHVFYFKYIRNLHFFLWFMLLPLFIFIAAEFMSQLFKASLSTRGNKIRAVLLLIAAHAGFYLWVARQGDAIASTFFSIGASLGLCLWYVLAREHAKGWPLWLALLIVVIPQSFQVFTYAIHNMPNFPSYEYVRVPKNFTYVTAETPQTAGTDKRCAGMYYSTAGYQELCQGVSNKAFSSLLTHKLVAYDRVLPFKRSYPALQDAVLGDRDVAFAEGIETQLDLSAGQGPVRFEKDSSILKVLSFQANRLVLKTDYSQEKFLVYFDNYAKGWKTFVDGHQTKLFVANGSFKGVLVPLGRHTVEFRYGDSLWYAFQWVLIVLFNMLFYGLVWSLWKGRRQV